ncbi:MAG: hypothetical protein CBC11_009600 [Proteobacteria bacterium TMED51]|nr:MAG: hypothetical protein CBC11_009600 [Proteobacteria bacterium TMED51]
MFKNNQRRTDITDSLMRQVRNTLQVVALGVLLMVHSLVQAGDLDGYRSSFLLGPLEEKLGTTLLYLSNNWSDAEREAVRLRLLMNGDTHIDLYVRASSSSAYSHGSTVTAGGSYLSYLTELKNAGLSPVLWLTPESKHPVDHQGTMDAQKAFMNSVVADYDGVTAAYVVCLECDEYWSAVQVNDLVTNLKSSTSKPIGVHLTPGVGGITGNTTYYDQADYIFLQIGDHTSGDFIADTDTAVAMLKKALALGKAVIVSEYALYSESSAAKALGDILCAQGALGTGNGRNVNFCGQGLAESSDSDSDSDEVSDAVSAAGTGVLVIGALLYAARLTNAAASFQLTDTSTYIGMDWKQHDRFNIGISYAERFGKDGAADLASTSLKFDYLPKQDHTLRFSYISDLEHPDRFKASLSYKILF